MDKKIDWSKAPEGATHYCLADPGRSAWRDMSGVNSKFWFDGRWHDHGLTSEFCLHTTVFQKRPVAPTWNGEGSPPFGTEIEVNTVGDTWVKAVLAYQSHYTCVFNCGDSDWVTTVDQAKIRPVRTPEQIADDERKAEIKGIRDILAEYDGFARFTIAAALHDAGYRKQ